MFVVGKALSWVFNEIQDKPYRYSDFVPISCQCMMTFESLEWPFLKTICMHLHFQLSLESEICIPKVTICNILSKNRSNVTPLAFNSHKMCYHRIYKHFLKFKARPVPSKNVTSPIGQAAILLGCDRFFQGLF